jgi:hypothetical protein
MASAAQSTSYETDYPVESDKASGWVAFAAIMLGLAGTWNVIDGILALANSKVYSKSTTFVFSDLRTWGWIILIVGVAEVCAAFALLGGSQVARWFGLAAAGVNSIAQLMFVPAAPFWALAMFIVDLLIIYALAAYGAREQVG